MLLLYIASCGRGVMRRKRVCYALPFEYPRRHDVSAPIERWYVAVVIDDIGGELEWYM